MEKDLKSDIKGQKTDSSPPPISIVIRNFFPMPHAPSSMLQPPTYTQGFNGQSRSPTYARASVGKADYRLPFPLVL